MKKKVLTADERIDAILVWLKAEFGDAEFARLENALNPYYVAPDDSEGPAISEETPVV